MGKHTESSLYLFRSKGHDDSLGVFQQSETNRRQRRCSEIDLADEHRWFGKAGAV